MAEATAPKRPRQAPRPKGEGGLYQVTKNGQRVWKAVVKLPDGSAKTATHPVKKEANKLLKELRDKWLGVEQPTDETVEEYLDWWLARQWEFVGKGRKDDKTVIDYANSLGYVKTRLGQVKLMDLTAAEVYELLVYLSKYGRVTKVRGRRLVRVKRQPLARRTVTRVRSHLDMALATAVMLGKIPVNVAQLVRLTEIPDLSETAEKRALTPEQAQSLLEEAQADPLVHAFLLVGLSQGLRAGENLGAGWDYLDWEGYTDANGVVMGTLEIERTLKRTPAHRRNGVKVTERLEMGGVKLGIRASERIMVLPPAVLQVLRTWQVRQKEEQLKAGPDWDNEHGLIFTTEVGTPMHSTNMTRRINIITKRLNMGHWSIGEFTRHSFATMIEADLQPQVLERAMGHSVGSAERRKYIHREKPVVTDHLKVMDSLIGVPS